MKDKPTWHETGLTDHSTGRKICVAETPVNLLVRLKGTRTALQLPWSLAYLKAADLTAMELMKQRKQRRASVRRGLHF